MAAAAKKWLEVAESIADRIRTGTVAIGDRLPSVAELAKQEGTSGTTVQRAAAFLAEVGAIRIDRNVGIFAAAIPPTPLPPERKVTIADLDRRLADLEAWRAGIT